MVQTSIFMRGTNSNHVKILVDGIDVSDPSTPGNTFDIAHLLLAGLDRIEVLRGPQSGLYGSDAIGGAIYIVTKAGAGPPAATVSAEGGSFGTFNQTALLSGASGSSNYAINAGHLRSTDIPVTPVDLLPPGTRRNDDSYDNKSFSTKLGTALANDFDVALVVHYIDATLHFTGDNFNVVPSVPDATRSEHDSQQLFTRGTAHLALFEGRFDETVGVAYTHDHTTDLSAESSPTYSRGNRLKVDWQGNITLAAGELVVLGAEHERDAIEQSPISAQLTTNSGYAQLQSSFDGRFFDAISVRYDNNDRFGGRTTFRIAPEYHFAATGTTVKGSIGSGFKAPTLNQLFVNFPDFGFFANPNLKPESSVGYDLGFEQAALQRKLRFGMTYFHNHIRDLIEDNSTFTSNANIDRATTYGFESFIAFAPSARLLTRADFTFSSAQDDVAHQELLRRPKVKASATTTWQASGALALTATLLYVGPWIDGNRNFTIPRLTAGGYTTANLAASYALSANLSLFGRINNVFDRRYEDPVGFDRPRFGAFAGIKATL